MSIQPLAFRESELFSVVDRFYEAAVQPALWKPVLHQASVAMGPEGALLISHPRVDTTVYSEGVGELVDAFVKEGRANIRATRGIQRDRWKLHSESTIATADELDSLPFYSDFLTRMGFRWFAGTTLAADGTRRSSFQWSAVRAPTRSHSKSSRPLKGCCLTSGRPAGWVFISAWPRAKACWRPSSACVMAQCCSTRAGGPSVSIDRWRGCSAGFLH